MRKHLPTVDKQTGPLFYKASCTDTGCPKPATKKDLIVGYLRIERRHSVWQIMASSRKEAFDQTITVMHRPIKEMLLSQIYLGQHLHLEGPRR